MSAQVKKAAENKKAAAAVKNADAAASGATQSTDQNNLADQAVAQGNNSANLDNANAAEKSAETSTTGATNVDQETSTDVGNELASEQQNAVVDSADSATAADVVKAVVGADAEANARALESLLTGHSVPLVMSFENLMPRQVCFPQIAGLYMGHCAGEIEERTATVTVRSFDDLHRVVLDIEAVCDLNGFEQGVALQVIESD